AAGAFRTAASTADPRSATTAVVAAGSANGVDGPGRDRDESAAASLPAAAASPATDASTPATAERVAVACASRGAETAAVHLDPGAVTAGLELATTTATDASAAAVFTTVAAGGRDRAGLDRDVPSGAAPASGASS